MSTNESSHAGSAIGSGVTGALVLTVLHQGLRAVMKDAPRMDVLGRRGITKTLKSLGISPPSGDDLQYAALAGDIAANTAYYAMVAVGKDRRAPLRGFALGLAAGLGAVFLPSVLGLGKRPSRATVTKAAMTVALYTAGGVAAGLFRRSK